MNFIGLNKVSFELEDVIKYKLSITSEKIAGKNLQIARCYVILTSEEEVPVSLENYNYIKGYLNVK